MISRFNIAVLFLSVLCISIFLGCSDSHLEGRSEFTKAMAGDLNLADSLQDVMLTGYCDFLCMDSVQLLVDKLGKEGYQRFVFHSKFFALLNARSRWSGFDTMHLEKIERVMVMWELKKVARFCDSLADRMDKGRVDSLP